MKTYKVSLLKNCLDKPYLTFLAFSISFIILGIVNNNLINIDFMDIYMTISINYWFYVSAVYFLLIAFNYYILKWTGKKPNKWLTILHLITQISSLVTLMISQYFKTLKTYNNLDYKNLYNYSSLLFTIAIIFFLISIFLHFTNFFTALFLKKNL
ncbi:MULTISPECIES: hypothetical protein [Polaribacter]|uniref:Uncharacterized protein n=1 Tax=Polaribacter marinaquae TaxID=1642819 RepID=A0ABZ2TVJ3_9FLAO